MKNTNAKLLTLFALGFVLFLAMASLISAASCSGEGVEITNGKTTVCIRPDVHEVRYVPCSSIGKIPAGVTHLNIEVRENNRLTADWHIASEKRNGQTCYVSFDTVSGVCKSYCSNAPKIDDLLKQLQPYGISNALRRAIEDSGKALDKFKRINLLPGASAYIMYVWGILFAAGTVSALIMLIKIILGVVVVI